MIKTKNEVISYKDWLVKALATLEDQRNRMLHIAQLVIGQTLFDEDIYVLSVIDKCIRIIDGFKDMIKHRNLTCAGILLRIQMDNCMRTYALYIAADKQQVIKSVLNSDTKLYKLRDKDGKSMKDAYLKEKINIIEPGFGNEYKKASGFIHHSEEAFHAIASLKEPNIVSLNIGNTPLEDFDTELAECTDSFIYALLLLQKLISPVIISKRKYDVNDSK